MVDDQISIRRGNRRPPRLMKSCRALLDRDQIDRGGLAAPVDLELELDPVALVEGDHAGPLHRRDVDEGVGLSVVAGYEAEALGGVEELDRARGLFAGQLALRTAAAALARRAPVLDRERIALDLEVGRRDPAAAIDEREF